MSEIVDNVTIAEWPTDDPRLASLRVVIDEVGQTDWVDFSAPWHQSDHLLVATIVPHDEAHDADQIVGFLRFVIQPIGPESDCETVYFGGQPLLEAKILAFAVLPAFQNQGVGRALQRAAIERSTALGCYQVRSHSSGSNRANHHLKLKLGFTVYPIVRGDDTAGVYFLLPLRAARF